MQHIFNKKWIRVADLKKTVVNVREREPKTMCPICFVRQNDNLKHATRLKFTAIFLHDRPLEMAFNRFQSVWTIEVGHSKFGFRGTRTHFLRMVEKHLNQHINNITIESLDVEHIGLRGWMTPSPKD